MVDTVQHDLGTNVIILQHHLSVVVAIKNRRSCNNDTYNSLWTKLWSHYHGIIAIVAKYHMAMDIQRRISKRWSSYSQSLAKSS